MKKAVYASLAFMSVCFAAGAESEDFPKRGIQIGQRLTLHPYVAMSYTFDSNIDSTAKADSGSTWTINPGLSGTFVNDNWKIMGSVWYRYHAYNRSVRQLNQSSYGERLSVQWANSQPNERGWSLNVLESFEQITQDDDMLSSGGRGIGRDRKELRADGVLERRVNGKLHAAVKAGYYLLDYENNSNKYGTLYGWKRTTVGLEGGYAFTPWTDLIFSGEYQWFDQDNGESIRQIGSSSEGWSVMAGLGTRATEKISYRVLGGYSLFSYGDMSKDLGGFTYQFSGEWKMSDTWRTMILGSSYFQPSESQMGTAMKVYSVSWGITKSLLRSRLNASFDIAYRREEREYAYDNSSRYEQNILTGRLGLVYRVNRFLDIYGTLEYQTTECDVTTTYTYDYDRFRATIGARLTY